MNNELVNENSNIAEKDLNNQNLKSKDDNKKKNNKKLLIIILSSVFVIILAVVLFIYLKNKNEAKNRNTNIETCDANVKIIDINNFGNGYNFISEDGDKYYIGKNTELESKKDLIYYTSYFNESSLKLCYEGDEKRLITKYEIKNQETGEKSDAETFDDLATFFGYHPYGNYTENATYLKTTSIPGYGVSSEGKYEYYEVLFKMENGKEIIMLYKIFDSNNNKYEMLKENEMYSIDFKVEDSATNKLSYVLVDINDKKEEE